MVVGFLCGCYCFHCLCTGSLFEEYCVLAEFQAEEPSQVSLKAGQMVLVVHKDDSGMHETHWSPHTTIACLVCVDNAALRAMYMYIYTVTYEFIFVHLF